MPGDGNQSEAVSTENGDARGSAPQFAQTSQLGNVALVLPTFNTQRDSASVATEWKKWKRAFGLYIRSQNISDNDRKQALLLHHAGLAVQDIYYTLSKGTDKTYEESVTLLDAHFLPTANIPFERHSFRQQSQSPDESIDQFVCRLRQKASTCEFGLNEDEAIRDQIIEKCRSSALRRKLLEKEGLTLDGAVKLARAFEAVDRQTRDFEKPEANAVHTMTKHEATSKNLRQHATASSGFQCYACGNYGHFAADKQCPARGKTCSACGAEGHFKVKCPKEYQRKKQQKSAHKPPWKATKQGKTFDKKSKGKGKVNQVTTSCDDCDEYAFAVTSPHVKQSGLIDLEIGDVPISGVLIDSGSNRNVIGRSTWEHMKRNGIVCESKKVESYLYPYSSEPLRVIGTFTATVSCDKTASSCIAQFYVTERDGKSLLSKETSESLDILRVGPSVNGVDADMKQRFPTLFSGKIGLLKDFEMDLHIDQSVKPVIQGLRRVPFGLREKVDKKLSELLEANVIAAAPSEPSGWISPLVVVPKGDDVRICVDMRQANQAVIRERYPIPTVDELLVDLNGSRYFSKLDLKMGFHQIQLSNRYLYTEEL